MRALSYCRRFVLGRFDLRVLYWGVGVFIPLPPILLYFTIFTAFIYAIEAYTCMPAFTGHLSGEPWSVVGLPRLFKLLE